jgi:hypothetical protein
MEVEDIQKDSPSVFEDTCARSELHAFRLGQDVPDDPVAVLSPPKFILYGSPSCRYPVLEIFRVQFCPDF